MDESNETLRWPTNLDAAAIVQRLVQVRETAAQSGPRELSELLAGVEDLQTPKIGAKVIAAINLVQDKPEFDALARQLAMLAMNLKNLKSP